MVLCDVQGMESFLEDMAKFSKSTNMIHFIILIDDIQCDEFDLLST